MGYDPLLIEPETVGGLIEEAFLVENYLPFSHGLTGKSFAQAMRHYLDVFQARMNCDRAITLSPVDGGKVKILALHGVYYTDTLIVAIGTKPKPMPWQADQKAQRRLFNSLRLMVGFLETESVHRGNRLLPVGIVGGGDCAFDYALSLSALAYQVEILTRSAPKAIPVLQKRAKQAGIIVRLMDSPLQWQGTSEHISALPASGKYIAVLSAIGRERRWIEGLDRLLAGRWPDQVSLIGDIAHPDLRQVAIAAGDGIRAALTYDHQRRYSL